MSDASVRIIPTQNGPYELTGAVTIIAPDGAILRETAKSYLCRCGHSGNKPFCDGTHRRRNWVADSDD